MLIDPKSSTPIFRQIADQLAGASMRACTKRAKCCRRSALAVDIKVNPNTIQRAYDALEREGIVETRRGVGIFVAKKAKGKRSSTEQKFLNQFEQ